MGVACGREKGMFGQIAGWIRGNQSFDSLNPSNGDVPQTFDIPHFLPDGRQLWGLIEPLLGLLTSTAG